MDSQHPLRILLLEDNPEDVLLVQKVLRHDNLKFITECVDTEPEFRAAIRSFQPDVVLSDHGLPGFNSIEALKICQQERSLAPFILVTGTMSDDYAVACLREGADDYILKSNLTRLPAAIRGAVKKRRLEKLKRLARHALRKQNDELLKINRELDNLVYAVSHNLRGPLVSVLGLLNVARSETSVTGMRPLHAMMEASILRLDETIHEILDYSRNARGEVKLGELDWQYIVASAWKDVEYLDPANAVKRNVDLVTQIPSFSDGNRIRVILHNLLSNALSFRSEGRDHQIGVRVVVSQTECKISVQDNGIGISADILPHVFNMFYRGTGGSQGAGLGLFIAREIVNKLKGKINIYSVLNSGTVVTVQLPNETSCELNARR